MLLPLQNILIHLIFIAHLASSTYVFASHNGNETDKLALLDFKREVTNDPFGILGTWNESVHFCNWLGVTCSTRRHPQRVIGLNLNSHKLEGSISPHIGNLSFLRVLRLQNNSFTNGIPSELGYLQRLKILNLQNNSLGGQIPPNISACSSLTQIRLSYDVLTGNIPEQLGSLSKLQLFAVDHNNLTGGIPASFGNLSFLQVLYASTNNISGIIPDALGCITGLAVIAVSDNKLIGTLPRSISNLSSIEVIDVGSNQIQGSLPSNLGLTHPNLNFLNVGVNRFTGPLPTSIANATKLEVISLYGNQLTGKVPTLEKLLNIFRLNIGSNYLGSGEDDFLGFISSLINATNLEVLSVDTNNFKGMLPKSIGNFSSRLVVLSFGANMMFGRIPSEIGNLINLEWINLESNQFIGNIPTEIGKIQNLRLLSVDKNNLSGELPSSLGNLTVLIKLFVGCNNFESVIPTSLEGCKNLLTLDVSLNNLTGTISQLMRISSLLFLNASHNHLTGPLPIEVGEFINLEELDVSENNLSGEIPSTLGRCVKLVNLIIEGNFFYGSIPSSLSSLKGLETIDLSRNNLSGKIPKYLEGFTTLRVINISFNDFEGEVPSEGVFTNATIITLVGNTKLCGGVPKLQLPKCDNSKKSMERGLSLAIKVIIVVITTILGLSLVLCVFLRYWYKERRGVTTPSISRENSHLRISYQSLFKATNGFSLTNLIGTGSFGHVYKGFLVELGGIVVAVKVFNLFRSGGSKSFIAECEALRRMRHRNLVKVITACSSVDHNGNEFKAIVYEFMDNGSLDKWLHPNNEEYSRKKLTLCERLNIAIDVASAVNYLHYECEAQIIHCDLKPSNILLDNEMIGHLGDLGLARLFPREPKRFPANQTSSLGIRGTVGYATPEYALGSEVSAYGDVYSFGILLLEMVTGKRPTDEMFKDGLNLHEFSKMALSKPLIESIDPILQEENANTTHNLSDISDHRVQECLLSILRIGIACSEESPRDRLAISDVLAKLHIIRATLLRAS
ncbi:hypothetical protein LguiB_017939 [Lonicera macranthoides]